jgi:hypothetical protein
MRFDMESPSLFEIRPAKEDDVPHIDELVKKLAAYEKLLDQYTATKELYIKYGFGETGISRTRR